MDQRTGQGGFDTLALAKAFGGAVQQGAQLQQVGQLLGAGVGRRSGQTLQAAEVHHIFPGSKAWVQAARIGQNAHACLRLSTLLRNRQTVHLQATAVRGE